MRIRSEVSRGLSQAQAEELAGRLRIEGWEVEIVNAPNGTFTVNIFEQWDDRHDQPERPFRTPHDGVTRAGDDEPY